MDTKEFIRNCERNRMCIQHCVEKMNADEIIELRANLNQKAINCEKGSLMTFEVSFMAAVLAVKYSDLLLAASAVAFVIAVLYGCRQLYYKSQCVKALSYLNDYIEKKRCEKDAEDEKI